MNADENRFQLLLRDEEVQALFDGYDWGVGFKEEK